MAPGMDSEVPDTVSRPSGSAERAGESVERERSGLFDFLRRRLPTREDAEDLLQDVLTDWAEVSQLARPIEHLTGWLYTVARRRISDWYRKRRPVSLEEQFTGFSDDDEPLLLTDLLATDDEAADDGMMRELMMDEIMAALDELPAEQRDVFVRHEIDGQSFREMADELNVPVNTLLSRKRYAVLFLRERLRDLYDEWLNDD
mgnify:CR=1 FL=1